MHEPLVSARSRLTIGLEFDEQARLHPQWASVWFAGLISDAIQTLPDQDPWRHLTGTVKVNGDDLIARGKFPVPTETGAIGHRGDFGTWHDTTDVRMAEMDDPALDIGLAVVADPIPKESAALLAFAGQGWASLNTAIGLLATGVNESIFDLCEPAVRWAYFRRNIYVGNDDPYIVFSAFAWLYRADMMTLGRLWDTAEVNTQIEENHIDHEAYEAHYLGN